MMDGDFYGEYDRQGRPIMGSGRRGGRGARSRGGRGYGGQEITWRGHGRQGGGNFDRWESGYHPDSTPRRLQYNNRFDKRPSLQGGDVFPYPNTKEEREEVSRRCQSFLEEVSKSLGPEELTATLNAFQEKTKPPSKKLEEKSKEGKEASVRPKESAASTDPDVQVVEAGPAVTREEQTFEKEQDRYKAVQAAALAMQQQEQNPQEQNPLGGKKLEGLNEVTEKEAETFVPEVFSTKEELKVAVKHRVEEIQEESFRMIPEKLAGVSLKVFNSIKGYERYVEDIHRMLCINRVLVTDYIREMNFKSNWSMTRESGVSSTEEDPVEAGSGDHHNPQPQSEARKVAFGGAVKKVSSGTYALPADMQSTPHPQKQSHDISHCSAINGLEDDAKYEEYGISQQYRKQQVTDYGQPLSSTLGNHGEQTSTKKVSVSSSIPAQQSILASVPTGHVLDMYSTFNGKRSGYLEWKSTTQTLLRGVEADMRPIMLKRLLKDPELALVGHVYHTDPMAEEEIWKALDKQFGSSVDQVEVHMTNLANWARNGEQCSDYASLQHLYNLLKENYFGIVRLGADNIGVAEGLGYGLIPLLFGWSQREVNRLKHENREPFNMTKVLEIIEKHLQSLQWKEASEDKFNASGPNTSLKSYSERDLPFLRKGLCEETDRSRSGYQGKNYDPNYKAKKGMYYERSREGRESYSKYRDHSQHNRYRDHSRDQSQYSRYRDHSSSRDQPHYSKYRDHSRERGESYSHLRDQPNYSKEDYGRYRDHSREYRGNQQDRSNNNYHDRYSRRDSSMGRSRDYSQGHYKDKQGTDSSPEYRGRQYRDKSKDSVGDHYKDRYSQERNHRYRDSSVSRDRYRDSSSESKDRGRQIKAMVHNVSAKVGEFKRGRDQTPGPHGRYSVGRSPSRLRGERAYHTFKCSLCLSDDHDVFVCKKYSAEQVFNMCNDRKFCYVCFTTGHGAAHCRTERHCTDSERCKVENRHHKLLCDKFKRAS